MYEKLTSLLEDIKTDSIGEWIVDKENDGSLEHPIQMPFVHYSECVRKFEHEVYAFEEEHALLNKQKKQILEPHIG